LSQLHWYISSRRLNKGNAGLLLNGASDLVAVETDKAEVLNTLFASVSTSKVSLTSLVRCKVQGGDKLPGRNQDRIRDHLREPILYKTMGPDTLRLRVQREMDCVVVICHSEGNRGGVKIPDNWRMVNVASIFKTAKKYIRNFSLCNS